MLGLDCNRVGADGVKLLAEALKVRGESGCSSNLLTELRVGFGLVQHNRALRTLSLDSNAIGAAGAEALAHALRVSIDRLMGWVEDGRGEGRKGGRGRGSGGRGW